MQSQQPKQTTTVWPALGSGRSAWIAVTLALALASVRLTAAGAEHQNDANSWRLATDDTEIVLSVKSGGPVLEALRSTATRRNWLMSPLKTFFRGRTISIGMGCFIGVPALSEERSISSGRTTTKPLNAFG